MRGGGGGAGGEAVDTVASTKGRREWCGAARFSRNKSSPRGFHALWTFHTPLKGAGRREPRSRRGSRPNGWREEGLFFGGTPGKRKSYTRRTKRNDKCPTVDGEGKGERIVEDRERRVGRSVCLSVCLRGTEIQVCLSETTRLISRDILSS